MVAAQIAIRRRSMKVGFVLTLFVMAGLGGCEKMNSEAVVLEKEHIDAAREASETRAPSPVSEQPVVLRGDEIAVDQYVMKPEDRGTERDPRAAHNEQWIVKVRTTDTGRTFNVQSNQTQFGKLKTGDRVQVRYRVGKYTKTVWAAQIVGGRK